MKIYRCDRCGKELRHHERNRVKTREWDNEIDKIDLCTDCFKKVERFIYGEKEEC